MKIRNLLAQRKNALNETRAQIKKIESANKDGKYDRILTDLRTKERRQVAAVKGAEEQLAAFIELGLD